VLHAIHDFLPRHAAGSEIYAFSLCSELSRRHDVAVLCAEYDPARRHGTVAWRRYRGVTVIEVVNNWAFGFAESYQSPRLNSVFRHALAAFQPDVLHVHSLLNLSFDLPAAAKTAGIATVATLHDYTLVCASGGQRVHAAELHVCEAIDPARCSRCFRQSPWHAQMTLSALTPRRYTGGVARALRAATARVPGLAPRLHRLARQAGSGSVTSADIQARLAKARTVFDAVDLFVAPSRAIAAEFVRLGVAPEKIRVSDYGFPHFAPRPSARAEGGPVDVPRTDARLRLGYVGTLVWHKGAHVLLEAVRRLPSDRIDVRVFGDLDCFPEYGRRLRALAHDLPVRFMGAFDRSSLPEVYSAMDVLVVPSLWPENSPLVIHEAFMAGVPVVAAARGGIPELVAHGRSGLLYDDPFSPDALAAALRVLLDDPPRVDRLAAALPSVKRIEDDVRDWEGIYEESLAIPSCLDRSPS
jgi:glycosyltransferase involved in cell wall biosynthesis